MELIWILAIVAMASLLKGITGFGFALVAFMPLSFWYEPKILIPVLILSNLLASVFIIFHKNEQIIVSYEFRLLIVFGAIFTLLGVLVLNFMPNHVLIKLMGLLFLSIAAFSLSGKQLSIALNKTTYKIAGAIMGLITGSLSVSGPPLALFLYASRVNNKQFREIFAWFSIVTSLTAVAGYIFYGLLTWESIKLTALFLPLIVLGTFAGKKLTNRIPYTLFNKGVLWITMVSSVMMLLK
jgi:uncharacterized membrane protein YfcA